LSSVYIQIHLRIPHPELRPAPFDPTRLIADTSHEFDNARAKGMPERIVIVRHALRNALLPTITVLAIDVGVLIGGIVVIETVFSYPGLGRLLIFAIERHDLPLIQAAILIVAAIYCVSNLIADLLYAYLNPKIRYGGAGY